MPAVAVAFVALAVMPPGYNVFGPVKLLVTFVAAATAYLAIARSTDARDRLRAASRSPVALAALALLTACVLSLVTTADARLALVGSYPGYGGLLAGVAWFALGGAAAGAEPDALRARLGRAVVAASLVIGTLALLQRLGFDALASSGTARVASTLGNASNLGVWLALAVPLLADRAASERGAWRALAGVALAFSGASAAFTGSRGGWLALGVALVAWVVLVPRAGRPPARRRMPALIALAAFALALSLTPGAAERAIGGGTAADTARGRLAVWSSTVPMIAERPVLGWGVAAYGRVHPRYATAAEVDPTGRTEGLEDPHNLELSVAAATGTVGLLALVALGVAAAMTAWRSRSGPDPGWIGVVTASLAGGLVALQFHFVTLETGVMIAVLLGALAGKEHGVAARHSRWLRPLALGLTGLFALLALGAGGLVVADVQVRRGFVAAGEGDWIGASAAFDAAEAFAPWEPAMVWAKGRAALDRVTYVPNAELEANGAEALAAAAARMPGDARPLRDLGDLRLAAASLSTPETLGGRWRDAVASYDAALTLAPLDPRALLGRGVASAGLGRYEDAERDLLRALELAPGFADAWENLGSLYDSLGRAEEAAVARARADALREQP